MGYPTWASKEQRDTIEQYRVQFLEYQEKKDLPNFWPTILNGFFEKHGAPEPTEADIANAKVDIPDGTTETMIRELKVRFNKPTMLSTHKG
jgi:hypothetical protein